MSGYRLFVNEAKTVLVTLWDEGTVTPGEPTVEVATREHPDDVWGPPVYLTEERA